MASNVLNFLLVVGVGLFLAESVQADFADNFDDGVVAPWVEFDCTYANPQSGAGNGVTESGGWLSTESAAWAMGPQRFTPPYTISVKVNFSGNPGDFDVSIRSSGTAGNASWAALIARSACGLCNGASCDSPSIAVLVLSSMTALWLNSVPP